MSQYITHTTFYRALEPQDLDTAIAGGHGLLLIGADGQQHYEDRPARFNRAQLQERCAAGSVYLVWATRWGATNELPDAAMPADASEPITDTQLVPQ